MTIIYIYIYNELNHDVDSPLQKKYIPHLLHILSYRQLLFGIFLAFLFLGLFSSILLSLVQLFNTILFIVFLLLLLLLL